MGKIVLIIDGGRVEDVVAYGVHIETLAIIDHDLEEIHLYEVNDIDEPVKNKEQVFNHSGVIAKNDELSVVSGCNGYYLYYGEKSACMGDGVDLFEGVNAGTLEFQVCMQELLNTNYNELIEAYFPDQD